MYFIRKVFRGRKLGGVHVPGAVNTSGNRAGDQEQREAVQADLDLL